MKCERAIPGTEIIVDHIWEVRIEFDIWRGIQEAAKLNDCTFSWVVRWCIFSALKTKNRKIFKTAVMELHNRRNLGAAKRESHHRFSLCLYGEDEKNLKLMAILYEVSVTSIILAALQLYLHCLEQKNISKEELFKSGIKIVALCRPEILEGQEFFRQFQFTISFFRAESFKPRE